MKQNTICFIRHIGGAFILAAALFIVAVGCSNAQETKTQAQPQTCQVGTLLVNTCGPWLGAWANDYSQVSDDFEQQILYHEQRVGRKMSIIHDYYGPNTHALTTEDKYFISRANTHELINWTPAPVWANAAGGDPSVNAIILDMANSVKSVAPTEIFLTLDGEPEYQVSTGTTCKMSGTGTAGSPADYVNMWKNVESIFQGAGVTNVVWVIDYEGYSEYDPCMTDSLYPGNSYIDWVAWDPYDGSGEGFNSSISYFYNTLLSLNNSTYSYSSKPWMIAEFGITGALPQSDAYQYYADLKTAIDNNTYPGIHAWIVFDSEGTLYSQVEYGGDPAADPPTPLVLDPTEQSDYNLFALDSHMQ